MAKPNAPKRMTSKNVSLASKSQSRAKKWTNTLENSRANKLKKRQERLDEIERQQQALDDEEDAIQREARKQMIDRAKNILFKEQGFVKPFKATINLSDSNRVNAIQIQRKKDRKRKEKELEAKFHKMQLEGAKRQLAREIREKEILAKQHADFAIIQQRQVEYVRKQEEKLAKEDWERGQKAVAVYKALKKEEQEARIKLAADVARRNREKVIENQELAKYKAKLKAAEEAELAKIEEYAKFKEARDAKRKFDMAEAKRKKQEKIDKMIERQTNALNNFRAKQRNIVHKHNVEAERKAKEKERLKEEKLQKLLRDIDFSRSQQINLKQQRKERAKEFEAHLMRHSRARVKELVEIERAERMAIYKKNKETQQFLLEQVKERERRKAAEKKAGVDRYLNMIAKRDAGDAELEEHLNGIRAGMVKEGLDPKPLDILLEKFRKTNQKPKMKRDYQATWTGPL